MKVYMIGEQAALERKARQNILASCSAALQELFEHKYLYQSVKTETAKCKPHNLAKCDFQEVISRLESEFFLPSTNGKDYPEDVFALLQVPETINTSCEYCSGETTPHNPMFDILRLSDKNKKKTQTGLQDQTMVFSYQCQKCKQGELVFLVRRTRLKFQLVGRSQIDKGNRIDWAPHNQRDLFSEALIASRTGSMLSAVCLLRIAIERHMREETGIHAAASGDELWEQYKQNVSSQVLTAVREPLKIVYGKLSNIIHGNDEDVSLTFEQCWKSTETFFKLKELIPKTHVFQHRK